MTLQAILLSLCLLTSDQYPVVNVRVIDGDTVKGTVVLPWGVALYSVRIRDETYDAWEASRRRKTVVITDEELRRGKEAKAAFEKLLTEGQLLISVGKRQRDRYGRVLGVLWIKRDGKTERLSKWMESHGYLRTDPGDRAVQPGAKHPR